VAVPIEEKEGVDGFGPFKISIYSSMGVSIDGMKMTG